MMVIGSVFLEAQQQLAYNRYCRARRCSVPLRDFCRERRYVNFAERWTATFDKPIPNMLLRCIIMITGLGFVAFAVALSRATGLGTSPISCVPAVLSYITPYTIGAITFFMNLIFIALQVVLLRRDFKIVQLLQIAFVGLFSLMIDLFVPLCHVFPMDNYAWQLFFTLISIICTAFGVFLEVKASLICLPGEGVVVAISRVTHIEFPKCKISFDTSLVVIGTVISLIAMGALNGVREGTIVSALTVGLFVKLFNKIFPHFERFAPLAGHLSLMPTSEPEPQSATEADTAAPKPLVITISRQYGSGGREIAHLVGDMLNIRVYDRTLIRLTAEESGLTTDFVRKNEEDIRRGILYNLYSQNYAYIGATPSETDSLFLAQARTITRLADHESCVLVGRNANFILANRENCFNVFIHAPLENRIDRVMKRDNLSSREEAMNTIERIDRERQDNARTYTNKEWGHITDYHLSVDSSLLAPEETAALIVDVALEATKQHSPQA